MTDCPGDDWFRAEKKAFRGQPGNIPDLPILIVVPVALLDQWISEIHKYLTIEGYDILPYVGSWEGHCSVFSEDGPFYSCKAPMHRRIVLATVNVRSSFFGGNAEG